MKKFLLIALSGLLFAPMVMAQDAQEEPQPKDWKWSGLVGLNVNATGMVNWAAGGKNNVAGTVFGKVNLLYDKNNLSWETNLDVEYGMTYIDQTYDKVQKSSDHLKFNTKFGWAFKPHWYLTAQAGFQTQFDLGKKYTGDENTNTIISNILAPSYTDISLGIDYKHSYNGADFSLYLSPIAGRITTAYVSDKLNDEWADSKDLYPDGLRQSLQEKNGCFHYDDDHTGGLVKVYDNAKAELGLTLKGSISYSIKDFKLATNVTLFTPYAWDKTPLYQYVEPDGAATHIYTKAQMEAKGYEISPENYMGYRDNNRRFGNFDVDWDVLVSYQFLKCLNITLTTNLKYVNGLNIADKDGNHPCERVQFLANLGLGVAYSF